MYPSNALRICLTIIWKNNCFCPGEFLCVNGRLCVEIMSLTINGVRYYRAKKQGEFGKLAKDLNSIQRATNRGWR
jgi:hypothetical protein